MIVTENMPAVHTWVINNLQDKSKVLFSSNWLNNGVACLIYISLYLGLDYWSCAGYLYIHKYAFIF